MIAIAVLILALLGRTFAQNTTKVGSFAGVTSEVAIANVQVQPSTNNSYSYSLSGNSEVFDKIKVAVSGNTLTVSPAQPSYIYVLRGRQGILVTVNMPADALKEVSLESTGDIVVAEGFQAKDLTLSCYSTGVLAVAGFKADSLTTNLYSTGNITAVGTFGSLTSTSDSTGQTDVFGLEGDAQVTLTSTGSMYIGASPSSTITGESSSTGRVTFGGGGTCNVKPDGCEQQEQSPPTISSAEPPSGLDIEYNAGGSYGPATSFAKLAGATDILHLVLFGAIAWALGL